LQRRIVLSRDNLRSYSCTKNVKQARKSFHTRISFGAQELRQTRFGNSGALRKLTSRNAFSINQVLDEKLTVDEEILLSFSDPRVKKISFPVFVLTLCILGDQLLRQQCFSRASGRPCLVF